MDPYKVLGVQPTDTDEQIKAAYRALVKRYHPDRYPEAAEKEAAAEKLKQINAAYDEIKRSGFDTYFVDHTTGVYPQAASGTPFSVASLQVTGDVFTDLHEDIAAEQKARLTYDNILRLVDDPDDIDPIRFLREREIVHYQRFCEAIAITQQTCEDKCNFYAYNPAFDRTRIK